MIGAGVCGRSSQTSSHTPARSWTRTHLHEWTETAVATVTTDVSDDGGSEMGALGWIWSRHHMLHQLSPCSCGTNCLRYSSPGFPPRPPSTQTVAPACSHSSQICVRHLGAQEAAHWKWMRIGRPTGWHPSCVPQLFAATAGEGSVSKDLPAAAAKCTRMLHIAGRGRPAYLTRSTSKKEKWIHLLFQWSSQLWRRAVRSLFVRRPLFRSSRATLAPSCGPLPVARWHRGLRSPLTRYIRMSLAFFFLVADSVSPGIPPPPPTICGESSALPGYGSLSHVRLDKQKRYDRSCLNCCGGFSLTSSRLPPSLSRLPFSAPFTLPLPLVSLQLLSTGLELNNLLI